MGSRVRIRLAAPFDILRFVRNLLFPFFKNSKSDVDERGHRLRFFHARRLGVMESFSIFTRMRFWVHPPVVEVTVYLSGRVIPGFSFWQLVNGSGEKLLRFWVTTPRIRKNMFLFYKKIVFCFYFFYFVFILFTCKEMYSA